MFVKVCGITRPEDAVAAAEVGVDAIGLNFVPSSKRVVDLDTAAAVLAATPAGVMTVGVFRDHAVADLLSIASTLGLQAVQLHGSEGPEVTAAVRSVVPMVIEVVAAGACAAAEADAHESDVVMVDAPEPGGGVPFDWSLVGDLVARHRVLLAGGLHPGNVAHAIERVRPWGVDVATGVESSPGVKDAAAMAAFVQAARAVGGRPQLR